MTGSMRNSKGEVMECEMMPHARKNSAKLTLSLLQVVLIPAAKGGIRVKIDKEGRVKGRTVPNRDELEVGGSRQHNPLCNCSTLR